MEEQRSACDEKHVSVGPPTSSMADHTSRTTRSTIPVDFRYQQDRFLSDRHHSTAPNHNSDVTLHPRLQVAAVVHCRRREAVARGDATTNRRAPDGRIEEDSPRLSRCRSDDTLSTSSAAVCYRDERLEQRQFRVQQVTSKRCEYHVTMKRLPTIGATANESVTMECGPL